MIKKPGELAGYTGNDGVTPVLKFTVGSIIPNFTCTSHNWAKPLNGHFLAIEILIQTETDLASEPDPFFHTGPGTWKVIGPDGITINTEPITAAAAKCAAAATRLPKDIGAGEKARGYVILDIPVTKGTALLSPPSLPPLGWEWTFPAV